MSREVLSEMTNGLPEYLHNDLKNNLSRSLSSRYLIHQSGISTSTHNLNPLMNQQLYSSHLAVSLFILIKDEVIYS
jgi:hypothetical protein